METNQKFSKKNFSSPDERREFKGHGRLDLVTLSEGTTLGCGNFEPGWRWSQDVKPLAETETCEAAHVGYCISGSMTIRMNDGEEFTIKPGDAFSIEPG